jgi:hypothetical protein
MMISDIMMTFNHKNIASLHPLQFRWEELPVSLVESILRQEPGRMG